MSDTNATPSRPVSLIATLFILALFAAFVVVVRRYYTPSAASAQNTAVENIRTDPKDPKYDAALAWKITPATRHAALEELRDAQAKQAAAYAWVDKKAGVVQLPIDRAMELTAQKYGPKK